MTNLSQFYINKAKKELGEDENKKRQALAHFKKWLERHPFIKMHEIDDVNLLQYLRRKKYSLDKAFQSFEDMKLFEKNHPEWFVISKKQLDNFAKSIHPLVRMLKHRDDDGRRVILIDQRPQFDISLNEFLKHFQAFFNAFLLEEETQIAGITIVFDCTGVKFSYVKRHFSPIILCHFFSQMKFFPIRIKQINIVGLPTYGIVMFELIRNFFSKKLRSRLNVLKDISDLQNVMDTSDLLLDDLSDYNEKNFVPIEESIKKAVRFYDAYEIDYSKVKCSKKLKTQKSIIIDEFAFD
ncbi:hypothetical protein PVAND_004658 [Polypedilum vanderplanki]|uniref:CRAL-TRIO domain-containing protein n=1 Tax=Polypedilum vanderplanki TaxID=319348 RepID=A0A9J6BY78_POLVA|nr:hypothetical protein PVAND_004658 [Polypedilum vanderplanki]